MSPHAPAKPPAVPTGNTFDKYGSSNPVVRRMMAGFDAALAELLARADPDSVLDVGCGEGVVTARWAAALSPRPVVGLDLEDPKLALHWADRRRENLRFDTGQAEQLPYADGEFDLVAAIETLEHLPAPERAIAEMTRVARRYLLVSVPREPVWRVLNLARASYVRELGNTPGHLNHWSKRGFQSLLSRHGRVVALRAPLPWTMSLVSVA